jgi:regulator of RNase E activity RraA
MSELTKTRKIVSSVSLELTESEIAGYVIEGVKRDHKELKDYDLKVGFALGELQLAATVEGERVS